MSESDFVSSSHLNRHEEELNTLCEIAGILAEAPSQTTMLRQILETLERRLSMRRGTIMLVSGDGERLQIEAARSGGQKVKEDATYSPGEGIIGKVFETGKPVIVPQVADEPHFRHRIHTRSADTEAISFICVPVIADKEIVGTLSCDLPQRNDPGILEDDCRFLRIISGLIARSIKSRRLARLEQERLLQENKRLRQEVSEKYRPENVVGNSSAMTRVFEQINVVSSSDTTVLITGESGTGKVLVASAIHYAGERADKPFVKVNCAALSESLLESELFGHIRGAFTGAMQERVGRFEEADGGTLFLDEIGDFSPAIQVKLLRVIQEREFQRVGCNKTHRVNVRIIAATHKDLAEAVRQGTFRLDLYYRINVFPIHLPSLRERNQDILALADHFVETFSRKQNKQVRRISTNAINMLLAYHWPGNVRELENCIEYAVLTSQDGVIHAYNLPPTLQMPEATDEVKSSGTLKARVATLERDLIIDALKRSKGNISAAARELGITARMVRYKLQTLNIDYDQLFRKG